MEDLDNKFIDFYKEVGKAVGVCDPILMGIFARLYIEPDEISMEDLAEKSGYSLASISNSVKMLSGIVPINRIRKPGSKRLFLKMDKDFLSVIQAHVAKQEAVLKVTKDRIPDLIKEYKDHAKSQKDKEKLKCLEGYYRQVVVLETATKDFMAAFDKVKE